MPKRIFSDPLKFSLYKSMIILNTLLSKNGETRSWSFNCKPCYQEKTFGDCLLYFMIARHMHRWWTVKRKSLGTESDMAWWSKGLIAWIVMEFARESSSSLEQGFATKSESHIQSPKLDELVLLNQSWKSRNSSSPPF